MRRIVSRPDPKTVPDFPLPFHVRSSGYNEAEPGWSEDALPESKPFVQFFWCVQGIGEFILPDRSVRLPAEAVFFQLPGERHRHRSVAERTPWCYYWFTLDGERAADFMVAYGYGREAKPAGACPVELFHELQTLLPQGAPGAQRRAVAVVAAILAAAGADGYRSDDRLHGFMEYVRVHLADPGLTAAGVAAALGVHRTTLNATVRAGLGKSPKEYIRQLRLQKALALLLETAWPVKCIAAETGFGKVDYFCAVIREHTGFTPLQYRRLAPVDSV